MTAYLVVSGDFVLTGGMDRANYGLAAYLTRQGNEVHLVANRVAPDLLGRPNLAFHRVPRPAGSDLLSEPLRDWVGRYWGTKVSARGGRVVVNGGNCCFGDVNWVHYVHAAHEPQTVSSLPRKLKNYCSHRFYLARERRALRRAHLVIANSARTKRDLVERVGVADRQVHTVYYGVDAEQFRPGSRDERQAVRAKQGWPAERPVVAFVGALGNRRKGFDTLFDAWSLLCQAPQWEADLAVIGAGSELPVWKNRAAEQGLASRIHFLGHRQDVPALLKACDVLVAPVRYEAYGLAVHEALCCGLPALVSADAGVAERYTPDLQDLLLPDADDVHALVERLRAWQTNAARYQAAVDVLADSLRAYTWDHMAEQMLKIMETVA